MEQRSGRDELPLIRDGRRGGSHKLPGTWRITDERELIPTDYGSRSYKDFAPTELVGERLIDHNAELTATADIIADSAMNSLT